MNLKPLGDRLVVEHVEQADKSAGGVFLPDTAKEKPQEGKVLAIGSGRTLDNGTKLPMDVKVGDRIIYSKYSGSEIKLEGTEYLIISEKDVLAIFTDSKVPRWSKVTWLQKKSYLTRMLVALSSAARTSSPTPSG